MAHEPKVLGYKSHSSQECILVPGRVGYTSSTSMYHTHVYNNNIILHTFGCIDEIWWNVTPIKFHSFDFLSSGMKGLTSHGVSTDPERDPDPNTARCWVRNCNRVTIASTENSLWGAILFTKVANRRPTLLYENGRMIGFRGCFKSYKSRLQISTIGVMTMMLRLLTANLWKLASFTDRQQAVLNKPEKKFPSRNVCLAAPLVWLSHRNRKGRTHAKMKDYIKFRVK